MSVAYYAGGAKGIPGWEHSVLITSLKRGLLFHVRLDPTDSVTIGDAGSAAFKMKNPGSIRAFTHSPPQ